ncbi:MAG: hypothetical protein AAF531_17665 [Actinomycetota bacterium]
MKRLPPTSVVALALTVAILVSACSDDPPAAVPEAGTADEATASIAPAPVVDLSPVERADGVTVIATCDPCPLELHTDFIIGGTEIDPQDLTVYTRGSFAYWWDSRFDTLAQARNLASVVEEVEADLATLGVGGPGARAAGYFTNIFIHRGDDDVFPGYFGNGTGYEGDDETGGPVFAYLAYPFDEDLAANRVNIFHEVFHVFQGASSYDGTPVIDSDGPFERAWTVEAMAEWYQMSRLGDSEVRAFENVAAIAATPQLPLWEFFPRVEPAEEDGLSEGEIEAVFYATGIRQYSNGAFFYHLTEIAGVDPKKLLDAMYRNIESTPQELLFDSLGPERFRRLYTEWASQTAADFSYLDQDKVAFAERTFESFTTEAPADLLTPFAITLDGADPNGTFSPDQANRPGAWAYNVARIAAPQPGAVSFTLTADGTGDQGTSAHFDGAVLIRSDDGSWRTTDLSMDGPTTGRATVAVEAADQEVLVVIASVPEHFVGNETYGYALTVAAN